MKPPPPPPISGDFSVPSISSSSSSSMDCRRNSATAKRDRLLLIATTAVVVLIISSSSSLVNSAAILPPHVLLKSDTSNVVDGARSTGPGTGTRQGGGGGGGGAGGGSRSKGHRSSSSSSSSWRLSPSDDLPPRPLIQTPTSKDSLPTRADRDPKTLAVLLGADFDAAFMSVKRPGESLRRPNGTYVYDNAVVRALSAAVKLPGIALPGRRSKIEVRGGKRQKVFQTYLGAYTYCPVHYKWIDLGPRFWPRWIRQGDCSGNKRGVRSCSFPAGMTCKPQRSTTKTVLWWHCQSPGQCQWIPIKYPVIASCKCAC